jgi:hypothetical protein
VFLNGHRADLDELMVAVMVPPITPFTVPVTVMVLTPVRVIPITISTIFVGPRVQRGAGHRTENYKGQK